MRVEFCILTIWMISSVTTNICVQTTVCIGCLYHIHNYVFMFGHIALIFSKISDNFSVYSTEGMLENMKHPRLLFPWIVIGHIGHLFIHPNTEHIPLQQYVMTLTFDLWPCQVRRWCAGVLGCFCVVILYSGQLRPVKVLS